MTAVSNLDGRPLKVGGLFAGYGGIELALHQVFGDNVQPAWFCEFDKAPSKILAHHWPTVPNFGDVTAVDWSAVEPVDIITGGSPCQDLSTAGKRAGMTTGTRSNLWVEMREAIATIRPRLVVWENVRGAGSTEADSAMEQCPRCVGDPRDRGPVLRALGRVLGDLSDLGYDSRWYGLRAADVGAAHGRFRFFVFATPADADVAGLEGLADQAGAAQAGRHGHPVAGVGGPSAHVPGQLTLLPSPRTSDTNGPGHHGTGGPDLRTVTSLLPTPTSQAAKHAGGDTDRGPGTPDDANLWIVAQRQDWRKYTAAIRRQEAVFGRPAPLPTEPGAKGQPRLSPAFVEWLMGLPAGHVTNVPGISRNDQLKALGNGVVPQQAAAATRAFLADISKEKAA